jgi:hypothetical protein
MGVLNKLNYRWLRDEHLASEILVSGRLQGRISTGKMLVMPYAVGFIAFAGCGNIALCAIGQQLLH